MNSLWNSVVGWFKQDLRGAVQIVLSLLILTAVVTTCSKVSDTADRLDQGKARTEAEVDSQDLLKQRIIELLIQNLNRALEEQPK
jgi:hypothetical protein